MVFQDIDPIKQVTIFDVQWSNAPENVVDAVRDLWRARELGNDYYYVPFDVEETLNDIEDGDYGDDHAYLKTICDYLTSRDIDKCLIHFWW